MIAACVQAAAVQRDANCIQLHDGLQAKLTQCAV
jgi:hypothetical protein